MESVATRQYMSFNSEEHPFFYNHWFNEGTEFLEHFAPRSIFSNSAQKYTDGQSGCEELLQSHVEILSLFTWLYWTTYEILYIPRKKAKKDKKKKKPATTEGDGEEEGGADEPQEQSLLEEINETHNEFFDAPRVTNRTETALFATMEVVPHYAAGQNRVAGIRLRIACNNSGIDWARMLHHLFVTNERRLIAEMNGKPARLRPQLYQTITFERYCALAQMYSGRVLSRRECNRDNLMLAGSAIHPREVFRLYNSWVLAKKAGAPDLFYREDQYLSQGRSCVFPKPERVYLLKHEYMKPDHFHSYMWPHVRKPVEKDTQRLLFIRQFVKTADTSGAEPGGADDEPDLEEDGHAARAREMMERELTELYEQYHRCRVSATNAMDMDALRRRQKERMDNAVRLAEGDFEKLRMARTLAQHEGLDEFQQIFHVDGDVPDSVKAIARWVDQHLTRFKNFRLPMKKCSRNLSRFGDVMSSMAVQMECTFKVATLQAEVVKGIIQNYHVYSNKPFHAHQLYVGPPKVGKTFSFQVQQECFIPGTWQEYAYQTPKANTSPGKKFNHMIEFLEEAPPSMLGVVHQIGGKRQPTAGTDVESILKLKLTRGKMVAKILVIDEQTKKRTTIDVEVDCNTVMNFASNENLSSINPAMLSRFAVRVFQYKDRPDSGGLIGKMQADQSQARAKMRQERVYRMRRNQALVAILFYMIDAGILAPIDLTAANIVFSEVLKKARENGLTGTDDVRNFERLCFQVEVVVLLDAIDILYDSEVSPLKGRKFDWKHMLLFEPYLKATVEHCTFVLGLSHEQFESDVLRNVVKTLKRTLFREAVAEVPPFPGVQQDTAAAASSSSSSSSSNGGATTTTTLPAAFQTWTTDRGAQLRANQRYYETLHPLYYVVEFPSQSDKNARRVGGGGGGSGEKSSWSKEELLHKLAQEMYVKMSPRPQMEDLKHALDQLTTLPIANERGEVTGSDFALYFAEGQAYLSKKVLKGFETHSLKSIIKEVLERVTRRRKQYLYGVTYDNRPYIWDTIIVDPPKDAEPIQVIDPNYFDEQVRRYDSAAGDDMYDELLEPGEEHTKASRARFFSPVFSSSPMLQLDTALDRYVAVKRLETIGIKALDLEGMPSVFPDVYQQEVLAKAREAALLSSSSSHGLSSYPDCFPLSFKEDKARMKRIRVDEDVSLKLKTQRLMDKLGFEVPPEQDEEVCVVDGSVEEEIREVRNAAAEEAEDELLRNIALDLDDSTVDSMAREVARGLQLMGENDEIEADLIDELAAAEQEERSQSSRG